MGDKVFIRVTLYKHMIGFGRKVKLAPRYIILYDIVEQVYRVAYRLALPVDMDRIHDVFHFLLLSILMVFLTC